MTNSRRTSRGPVPDRGSAVEKHCPMWLPTFGVTYVSVLNEIK